MPANRLQHGLRSRIVGLCLVRHEEGAGCIVHTDPRKVEILAAAVLEPGVGEKVDQRSGAGECPFDPLRPDDRCRSRHDGVRGVAGLAGGIGGL